MEANLARRFCYLVIALLLLLSCVPRFYDIAKFLPAYSIDENDIVEPAVAFLAGDVSHPQEIEYGPLYGYILAAIYWVESWFMGDLDSFVAKAFFESTIFYYTARFVNSLVNVLVALIAFLTARTFLGGKTAFFVFALLVFPFPDILTGFDVRNDTLLSLWSIAALYFILGIAKQGLWRNYLFAALFVGLGLATKPAPGLLIFPVVFLAHLLHFFESQEPSVSQPTKLTLKSFFSTTARAFASRYWWGFVATALLAGIVFNPHVIINADVFFGFQSTIFSHHSSLSHSFGWMLWKKFGPCGYPFMLVALISFLFTVHAILTRRKHFAVWSIVASYPLIYCLAFAPFSSRIYFYTVILPPIVFMIAFFVTELHLIIKKRTANSFAGLAPYVVVFLIVTGQPGYRLVSSSIEMNTVSDYSEVHSALAAKAWCESTLPPRSRILMYEYYTFNPRLVHQNAQGQAVFGEYFEFGRDRFENWKRLFRKAYAKQTAEHPVFDIRHRHRMPPNRDPFEYCLDNNIDYVITTDRTEQYRLFNRKDFADRLIKRFTPLEGYTFGRPIYIYELSHVDSIKSEGKGIP